MRARNLKPGFFKNEDLAEVSFEARILFAGLWCFSDREGRFEWRPKKIEAEIFPYDRVNIDKLLGALLEKKFIEKYQVGGHSYGWIPTFLDHQKPHDHEAKSKIPENPNKYNVMPCQDIVEHNVLPKSDNVALNPSSLNPSSLNPDIKKIMSSKLDPIPFSEIISYLNQKTKKHFSHKTKAYQGHIRARWNEGKRLDDFKRVVDIKFEKWGTDQKMIDYLRPETLFGTKMDTYLNEGGPILETSTDKLIYEMKQEREKKDEHS